MNPLVQTHRYGTFCEACLRTRQCDCNNCGMYLCDSCAVTDRCEHNEAGKHDRIEIVVED